MATNHFLEDAPPMWWISCSEPDGPDADIMSGQLHLGHQHCFLNEIVDYDIAKQSSRDNDGLILAGMGFLILAALFLNAIVVFGWSWKFWLAVGFCGFFSVVSLIEASQIAPVTQYDLHIYLVDDATLAFSSADLEDVSRLVEVLEDAVTLNGMADGRVMGPEQNATSEHTWTTDRAA
ncbi:MAG: hypothetical protein AAFV45_00765 [Pseudomonadota bacterium]